MWIKIHEKSPNFFDSKSYLAPRGLPGARGLPRVQGSTISTPILAKHRDISVLKKYLPMNQAVYNKKERESNINQNNHPTQNLKKWPGLTWRCIVVWCCMGFSWFFVYFTLYHHILQASSSKRARRVGEALGAGGVTRALLGGETLGPVGTISVDIERSRYPQSGELLADHLPKNGGWDIVLKFNFTI